MGSETVGGQEGFAGYWTPSPGYCSREPWKGWEWKGSCTEHVDEQLGKSGSAHAAGVEIPWEVADLKSQAVPAASRGCKELPPCDVLCSWDLGQCKDIWLFFKEMEGYGKCEKLQAFPLEKHCGSSWEDGGDVVCTRALPGIIKFC